jgi:hypothetical protein
MANDGARDAGLPYGARFFDELRRVSNSAWGFNYRQIEQMRSMSRERLLGLLSRSPGAEWILSLDSTSPEEFARTIVEEGKKRTARAGGNLPDPLLAILDLAQFLPH